MARRDTLRQLEARVLREYGDLPPPLDTAQDAMSGSPLLYSNEETPVTYKQRSNIKANPQSPFTRIKPLLPNILDHAAVMSVHKYTNLRKRSGHKWVPVQEK
jgi:hypothetical protein